MAIDTARKRASVASLGLAFLGASIVPDGSFVEGDRQTIGHGYYGLSTAATEVTIGATTQLTGAFDSTGGITNDVVIGATTQLTNTFDSTGGITNDVVIGATVQLTGAFDATGGITNDVVIGATAQMTYTFDSSGTLQVGDVAPSDPLDFGWLPSIRGDETPEELRRKRNARYRYLANV